MSKYNVVDNTELVKLIERGLRKGYWDKALIPELKKRFKEIEKKEKLLELYIDLANTLKVLDNAYGYEIFEFGEIKYILKHICNKIKELENEKR